MHLRPYHEGDLEHIIRRPHDDYGPESFENTKRECEQHMTFTFIHDGIPVAIIGIEKLWTGVAGAWTVVSDHARGKGLQLTKQTKKLLDDFCKAHNIRRVQAIVKEGVVENQRWMETLGFYVESIMNNASPEGDDLLMFVRLYNE